jgi:hypothetical protein
MELRPCVWEAPAPSVNGFGSESIKGENVFEGGIAVKAKV